MDPFVIVSDRDANCILPTTKSLIWTGAPGLSEAYADEAPDGDEIVQAVPDKASPVSLWPEELYAEVMHCYMPDKSRLVDILPGSGMKAVAAARMGKSYVGFVRSALHAALIRETVAWMHSARWSQVVVAAQPGFVNFSCARGGNGPVD